MSEERQRLDILYALDSGVRVRAEPLDRLLRLFRNRHLGWKGQRLLPSHDLLVGLLRVFRAEGRVADQHLEHDDAKRPPIAGRRVPSLEGMKEA